MATQSSITVPAPTPCRPLFLQSQRFLDKKRLHLTQNGQGYSISFARQILPSAGLRVACWNTRCAAVQTQKQTLKSPSSTVTIAPPKGKEKPPKLDDGNSGFPPWHGGGGGGGGGGSGSSSGGFFLFALLVFFDYLKELEGDESYDNKILL
ncbi:hypothetical protein Cni_G22353 [Canna indica]|uniref:Uncharacterized protein n=1 Tax=Canna indica TaxID=4628 RepID=A0AAQ3KUZ5_9LILI|nr:hypothetical protein Cni_G22353 [Canna indica]